MKEFSITSSNVGTVIDSLGDAIDEIINSGSIAKIKLTNSGRSLGQNALLHEWCNQLSAHLIKGGRDYCTTKWVKQALKATFLGSEEIVSVNLKTGEKSITEEIRHSSNLSKGEMFDFLTQIQGWAINVNCILTAPVDSEYQKLNDRQNS